MMYWIPLVAFVSSAVIMVTVQGRYFAALARRREGIASDADVSREILGRPLSLPVVVANETARRLRSLVTRQRDSQAERGRLLACASILLTVVCFVWTTLSWGTAT
jgi:hypothetical protein